MSLFVLAATIFVLVSVAMTFFFVVYIFIGDFKKTVQIIRDAALLAISENKRNKKVEDTKESLNLIFSTIASEITEMPDKEVESQLHISKSEAKEFKKELTQLLRSHDFEFFSTDDVKRIAKKNHSYSFTNSVYSSVRLYSNKKILYLERLAEKGRNNVSEKELREVAQMSPKSAEIALRNMHSKDRFNHRGLPSVILDMMNLGSSGQKEFLFEGFQTR